MNEEEHIPGGYILLSRKLLRSGIMEKPPLYIKLWIWVLLTASHSDHGSLKRGQLFTSLERMRDAMKYRVGAVWRRPTKKEVRTACDFLTKGTMMGTVKGTHGVLITVLNYDYYQNPTNYEGHTERHNEGKDGGEIKTRMDYKKKSKILSSEVALEISTQLAHLILSRNPKFKKPDFGAWARHVDLMLGRDGRDPGDVRAVVEWCQRDPFWQDVILSTENLRRKFDQLYMRMKGNGNKPVRGADPHQPKDVDLESIYAN